MEAQSQALRAEIERQRQALESVFKHDLIDIKAHTDETLIRLESKMDKGWTYPDFVDSFLTGLQSQVDAGLSPAGVAHATQTPAGGNPSSG